jgi:Ran-binding protein 1
MALSVEEELALGAEFKKNTLTEVVEVKKDEDNAETLFTHRSKLYHFITEDTYGGETRTNYWKERGLGDIKILKDKTKGTVRVIMRQEKTLKPCANFALTEECSLTSMGSSVKAWVFNCHDFSDGGELKPLTCSIKFKNEEIANKFRDAFNAGKKSHAEATAGGDAAAAAAPDDSAKGGDEAPEEKDRLDEQAKAYRAGVEKRRASITAQNALNDSDYDSNEEDVDERATVSGSIAATITGDKTVDTLAGDMAKASVQDKE